MSYSQKDYPDKFGSSKKYTISEAGSLLIAFANLLGRTGNAMDPRTLDAVFREKGLYKEGDALSFSAAAHAVDRLGLVGRGIGRPIQRDAIVKMVYHSPLTDKEAVAYALVEDPETGKIIDSYDGNVRSWDVYGGPKEWASFGQLEAQPLTPMIKKEEVSSPVLSPEAKSTDTYAVVTMLRGYNSSAAAEEHGTGDEFEAWAKPGNYYIFNRSASGMINVTKEPGKLGYWVNPAFNLISKENDESKMGTKIEDTPPVEAAEAQLTLAEQLEKTYIQGKPIECIAINDTLIRDVSGKFPPKPLKSGQRMMIVGMFNDPDGTKYFRTDKSVERGQWYGVPKTNLRRYVPEEDIDQHLDKMLSASDEEFNLDLSGKEKVIRAGATVEGKIKKLFNFGRK